MINQHDKAANFHSLHIKSQPVILYNIWDPGSARAIAELGVSAIATGSHGVANANGYPDGEKIPFDLAISNAKRVVQAAGDLPVTMDIETGYGSSIEELKSNIKQIIESGVVGINFEDTVLKSGELRPVSEQVERIQAVRAAAQEAGIELFINARTDIFKIAAPEDHNDELVDQAIERGEAYIAAGADGFFPVLVRKIDHIKRICETIAAPVNIIYLSDMNIPSPKELASAGASRISYGPGPYLAMIEWLKEQAKAALAN